MLRAAVIRKDVEPVLREIEAIEGEIARGSLVRARICFLMDLYQRAIEHFSAVSDTSHREYLERLRVMLGREDVQLLMMEEAKAEERKDRQAQSVDDSSVVEPVEKIASSKEKE